MAFPNVVKTNFGGGELSPQMQSRADLPIYGAGLRTLENFFLTQTAGVRKREGWEVVVEQVFYDQLNVEDARLVPMVRADGEFSLLVFGWGTRGDNGRDVACFSEVDSEQFTGDQSGPQPAIPFGPLHFLTSEVAPPPPVPTHLRCEVGNGFVRLHWRGYPGSVDYDYRYKLATASDWTEVVEAGDIGPGEPDFIFTTVEEGAVVGTSFEYVLLASVEIDGLTNEAEYEFQVRGRSADTQSAWSEIGTCAPSQIAPATPEDLEVTAPPECGLRVTWSEVSGATQYQVRMRSTSDPVAPWDESHEFRWQNGTVRRINNVLASVRYEIQVRARNAEFSSWSRSEYGTPVCGQAPGVPQNVDVEIVDRDSVDLSWDRVDDATFYVWQTWPGASRPFGQLPRGERVEQGSADRITARIDNLGLQQMHTFRVRSAHHPDPDDLSTLVVSEWSVTASIIAVPRTPTNVTVSQSGPFRTIEWDESPGAEEYIVRREWRNIFHEWVGRETIYEGPPAQREQPAHIDFDPGMTFGVFNDLRYSVAARNQRGRSNFSGWVEDPGGFSS